MVIINKVYTKQGDQGLTHLVGGSKRGKDDPRVKCYGEVDELNAFIGDARTKTEQSFQEISDMLSQVQNELFDLGAELATPEGEHLSKELLVGKDRIERLEQWIDSLNEELPTLKSFVLPGGTPENASLHICRTVCRRVERTVVGLSREEDVRAEVVVYFNRLSDLLFVMARTCASENEYLWSPGKKAGT